MHLEFMPVTALVIPRVDMLSCYSLGGYSMFVRWTVFVGLPIKLLFVRYLTGFSWSKSTLADVVINIASLPIRAGITLVLMICWGANETAWLWVAIIVIVVSALTEAGVLQRVFAKRIGLRDFSLLCIANAICVVTAMYRMYAYIVAHPPIT